MQILPGKKLSEKILKELRDKISTLEEKPKLTIIQIGEEQPSNVYVSIKERTGRDIGIAIETYRYQKGDPLLVGAKIKELNQDSSVHGIILQLPTPGTEVRELLELISPDKDVDGLTSKNLGLIWHNNNEVLIGATPKAILFSLEYISQQSATNLEEMLPGKNVLIINHNILIGKPLAGRLLELDATVTIAHSQTKDLDEHIEKSDIIITATGSSIINKENRSRLKQDVVIIDSGYSMQDGVVNGDVDIEAVRDKASWLTPVPGGIGPLGVAMLMQNTYESYLNSLKKVH